MAEGGHAPTRAPLVRKVTTFDQETRDHDGLIHTYHSSIVTPQISPLCVFEEGKTKEWAVGMTCTNVFCPGLL